MNRRIKLDETEVFRSALLSLAGTVYSLADGRLYTYLDQVGQLSEVKVFTSTLTPNIKYNGHTQAVLVLHDPKERMRTLSFDQRTLVELAHNHVSLKVRR